MQLKLSKFDKIIGITVLGILVVGGVSALVVKGMQGEKTEKVDIPESEVVAPIAIENLVYNGEPQALIEAGSCSYGTFYYKVDDSSWAKDVPMETESGSYIISWIIIGNKTHNNYGSVDNPFHVIAEIK